jgi:polysaccharide deacetylase family protein (PEP-CTERM system associated)
MLSFDIEDWFQVENLREAIPRTSWDHYELRVIQNTHRLLELLELHNTKATFFILGWVANKAPKLIKEIYRAGHEIASHGYGHELIYKQTLKAFQDDIDRSKSLLEDLTGEAVLGYRAPSFSITERAIEVLVQEGFVYDSSFFPSAFHDRYGRISSLPNSSSKGIVEVRPSFFEILIPTLQVMGVRLPWGGGGYFRALPYKIFCKGIKKILSKQGTYLFYLHPWEIDPEQPRIRTIKRIYKLRHYVNLGVTTNKLNALLRDFQFIPIKEGLKKLGYSS